MKKHKRMSTLDIAILQKEKEMKRSTDKKRGQAPKDEPPGLILRWAKMLCGVSVVWIQVIFGGALFSQPWLVNWGLASFLVVFGVALMGMGIVWAKHRARTNKPTPEPPQVSGGTRFAEGLQVAAPAPTPTRTEAHCSLCARVTPLSEVPGLCAVCGLDRAITSRPALQDKIQGYHELQAWDGTIEKWLAAPTIAAQQVFHCSAALVALVARFPCLKRAATSPGLAREHTLDQPSGAHEALGRSSYDRTWGDAELVLDELCMAQEKTRVDEAAGSQRGLLLEAQRYTKQLLAQMWGELCAAAYCADELLVVELEPEATPEIVPKTTIIPQVTSAPQATSAPKKPLAPELLETNYLPVAQCVPKVPSLPSFLEIPEMEAVPRTTMIPQVR